MVNASILVVEDKGIIAKDIRCVLEGLGYTVVAVTSSGEEAIKETARLHPDLVLMGIILNGAMDGVEAAGQIRVAFHIPVVFLTAYADEDLLQRAKITRPYGYVLKPFDQKQLRAAIEIALYNHRMDVEFKQSEPTLDQRLQRVLDFIEQNLGRKVTLGELASEACLSSDRLRHLFKEVFHASIREYCAKVRIEQAKKLLRDFNLTISDIAGHVGYSVQQDFTRDFKKLEHQTPSQFRKSLAKLFLNPQASKTKSYRP